MDACYARRGSRPTRDDGPMTSTGGSGADAASRKARLRERLRAARRVRYGGTEGSRRRRIEGERLREIAGPLVDALRDRTDAGEASMIVAAFHPVTLEPDVLPLLTQLAAVDGVRLLFPVAAGPGVLDWVLATPDAEVAPAAPRGFGAEPLGPREGHDALARADLALAPALALSADGARLGHGGGYYDRALLHRRPGAPVVGIVHPGEVLPPGEIPCAAHDLRVDAVLSADGLVAVPGGMLLHGAADPADGS